MIIATRGPRVDDGFCILVVAHAELAHPGRYAARHAWGARSPRRDPPAKDTRTLLAGARRDCAARGQVPMSTRDRAVGHASVRCREARGLGVGGVARSPETTGDDGSPGCEPCPSARGV